MDIFADSGMGAISVFYMMYMVIMYGIILAFAVVTYILEGKSFSAIARRRGIDKPWLAWVPVGKYWLLGCISDQYRYLTYDEETNRRDKLLRWNIILCVVSTLLGVICGIILGILTGSSDEAALTMTGLLLLMLYGWLAVSIVWTVQLYKCYYDLFRSCDPDKSLIFLLVSIFTSYPLPIFVYLCRNKDLGMPPRKTQLPPETE